MIFPNSIVITPGVPCLHSSGRHIPGVPPAGVHPGRSSIPSPGVRAFLLRRAPWTRRTPPQRSRSAAAVQLHGIRAGHTAEPQRLPQASCRRRWRRPGPDRRLLRTTRRAGSVYKLIYNVQNVSFYVMLSDYIDLKVASHQIVIFL